jgi:hypothetical protein
MSRAPETAAAASSRNGGSEQEFRHEWGRLRLFFISLSLGFSRALGVLALLLAECWCMVCNTFAGLMGGSYVFVRWGVGIVFFLARTLYPILGWLEGRVIHKRRRSWS